MDNEEERHFRERHVVSKPLGMEKPKAYPGTIEGPAGRELKFLLRNWAS